MLYHIYVQLKDPKNDSVIKLGMSEEQLRERILHPYEQGWAFVVNGRTIAPDNLEQIQVSRGEKPAGPLLARADAELRSSSLVVVGSDLRPYRAFTACEDVTDEFILGPPGYKATLANGGRGEPRATRSKKVFIVHGHDTSLKNGVARFIEALDLEAVVLHERPDQGQTVIEKFEREADVGFAVVLCTADDLAESQRVLEVHGDGVDKAALRRRARQNVIFELGYFVARLGRAAVATVVDPGVEIPSDFSGVIYISRARWQTDLLAAFTDASYSTTQEQSRKALALQA